MNINNDAIKTKIIGPHWYNYNEGLILVAHDKITQLANQLDTLSSRQRIYFSELERHVYGNIFTPLHNRYDNLIRTWDIYITLLRTYAHALKKQSELIRHSKILIADIADHYVQQVHQAEYEDDISVRETLLHHGSQTIAFIYSELETGIKKHITHTRGLITALHVQGNKTKQSLVKNNSDEKLCVFIDPSQAHSTLSKLRALTNHDITIDQTSHLGNLESLWSPIEQGIEGVLYEQNTLINKYEEGILAIIKFDEFDNG